jgi:hypothetical protein
MAMRSMLTWIFCRGGWLLLSALRSLILGATLVLAAILAFVVAAQVTRYSRTSEWHPVPNAELLEIMNIDVRSMDGQAADGLARSLIDVPAPLCLGLIVVFLLIVIRSTRGLEWNLRTYDPHGARRGAMIRQIEGDSARRP